jgi:glutathione synthase/RimK-type ligase-like ATP-grasp enzyme
VSAAARVALVTNAAHPTLSADDQLLRDALAARGFLPVAARWDDAAEEWSAYDAVVIRSCWDYHHRAAEFGAWLVALERQRARVFNPLLTLRWNTRKTYLRDLAARGVPVVPTVWVARGDEVTLAGVLRQSQWDDAVVKPTVSASAFETWRTRRAAAERDEHRFAQLARERDLMIQPYMPTIEGEGELSLIYLGGRFSHAVRKRPRPGDFRVQHEFGGTSEPMNPDADLVAQGARIVAAAPTPCLYARVDGCVADGQLTLMELELIEPSLFFGQDAGAADRFVEALREEMQR